MDTIDLVLWAVIALFSLLIMGMILFICLILAKYKHVFIIKEKTHGVYKTTIAKARIVKDRQGFLRWKLLKFTDRKPPSPPAWAREITKKGNFIVFCEYSEETGFLYRVSNTEIEFEEDGEYRLITSKQVVKYEKATEVLSVNAKNFLLDEWKKSHLERPSMTWQEVITGAIPWFALLIIVGAMVVMFSMWKDIAEPSLQAQKNEIAITANIADATKNIDNIYNAKKEFSSAQIQNPDLERPK